MKRLCDWKAKTMLFGESLTLVKSFYEVCNCIIFRCSVCLCVRVKKLSVFERISFGVW